MRYEAVNGTLTGENLAYLFVYANSVTHGLFGIGMLITFFAVVFLGSLFAQFRWTVMVKVETSLLASLFATTAFGVILAQYSGIIAGWYLAILLALDIIVSIWVAVGKD